MTRDDLLRELLDPDPSLSTAQRRAPISMQADPGLTELPYRPPAASFSYDTTTPNAGYGPRVTNNPATYPMLDKRSFWEKFQDTNSGGKVLGMKPDEFAMTFGRLAAAIAPNTVAGRMGEQVAAQGQYANTQRREDEKPENVLADMRLKAIQNNMAPANANPIPTSMTPTPGTATQAWSSPMLDKDMFTAPTTLPNPMLASAAMLPNSLGTKSVYEAIAELEGGAELRKKMLSMTPLEREQAEASLASTRASTTGTEATTRAAALKEPYIVPEIQSQIKYQDNVGQHYANVDKLGREEFDWKRNFEFPANLNLKQLELSLADRRERNLAEDRDFQREQVKLLKSSEIASKHETGVNAIFSNAYKLAEKPGAPNYTRIHLNAVKDAIPATMAWINDAKKLNDPAALMSAGNALYQTVTSGVNAVNEARDAKEAKEAYRTLLSNLSPLAKDHPELFTNLIQEIPGRVRMKGYSRTVPSVGWKIPGTTKWEFDPYTETKAFFGGQK